MVVFIMIQQKTIVRYIDALHALGYEVTRKPLVSAVTKELVTKKLVTKQVTKYEPVQLAYIKENQQAFKEHLALGKTVRLNFGLYKKNWVIKCFSTYDEMKGWLVANPYRIKYIKSVSLL